MHESAYPTRSIHPFPFQSPYGIVEIIVIPYLPYLNSHGGQT